MAFDEIISKLSTQFGESVFTEVNTSNPQPFAVTTKEQLIDLCKFLHTTEGLYFDMLSCITGVDLGVEKAEMEVIYQLYSIPYNHHFTLKVIVERTEKELPTIPSLTGIWKTANWHEREAYDLLGIRFENHPDLRRILLPNDWEGYPLRKDYEEQERYHGITVKYEKE
ncbi:MAG: NADH-quinone oxidoreductase subunit C [Cyclobacteriaceae bacterium]